MRRPSPSPAGRRVEPDESVVYTNAPPHMDFFFAHSREIGTVCRLDPTSSPPVRGAASAALREVVLPTEVLGQYTALYLDTPCFFAVDGETIREYIRRGWVILDDGVELKGD